MNQNRHRTNRWASGGSMFLNLRDAAGRALIRAAASTQPFDGVELFHLPKRRQLS